MDELCCFPPVRIIKSFFPKNQRGAIKYDTTRFGFHGKIHLWVKLESVDRRFSSYKKTKTESLENKTGKNETGDTVFELKRSRSSFVYEGDYSQRDKSR